MHLPLLETWLSAGLKLFHSRSRVVGETRLAQGAVEVFGRDTLQVTGRRTSQGVTTVKKAIEDKRLEATILNAWDLPGVRAGSGLGWHGEQLVVVQDDAFAIAHVDPKTRAIRLMPLVGDGAALPKATKPDFEAVFTDASGLLVITGSGSKSNRHQWARLDATATTAQVSAMDGLYAAVEKALGEKPNLEGAVAAGDRLHLFHRGAGDRPSAVVEVVGGQVVATHAFDLGTLDGVKLAFTDATALPDGRKVYLAAAEATPNAIDDGKVMGTAVGVLTGDEARWTVLKNSDGSVSRQKVEGIALTPDGRKAYMVTDADDPSLPARLLEVLLHGF